MKSYAKKVGWKNLCVKSLFITKVVLQKYSLRICLEKLYAKIMCIDYNFSNYTVAEKEFFLKRKIALRAVGDSLAVLLVRVRIRRPLTIFCVLDTWNDQHLHIQSRVQTTKKKSLISYYFLCLHLVTARLIQQS